MLRLSHTGVQNSSQCCKARNAKAEFPLDWVLAQLLLRTSPLILNAFSMLWPKKSSGGLVSKSSGKIGLILCGVTQMACWTSSISAPLGFNRGLHLKTCATLNISGYKRGLITMATNLCWKAGEIVVKTQKVRFAYFFLSPEFVLILEILSW